MQFRSMQFRSLPWISAVYIAHVIVITASGAEQHGINPRAAQFRVDSELVVLPLSIVDRMGRTVLGLAAGDFVVAENGVAQQVLTVSRWEAPTSIGIVFDTSGSMKIGIRMAQAAVKALLHENGDQDEAFLLSFGDSPRLEARFTNNNTDQLPDSFLWATPRGATALFDAVYVGLAQMKQAKNPRRALVIITDGGDNHSRHSIKEVLSVARESDVQVFTIAVRRDVRDSDEQRGRIQLDRLANETGGHLVIVNRDAELAHAMAEVNDLIRNQYLLVYKPAARPRDGRWHRVRVRLQPSSKAPLYRVYSKDGYYAPEQ